MWIHRTLKHPVAHNALGLYGVQIAGYVIPLVTLPYLARTLHPGTFGLLLFAQSFAGWASLTIEYGFSLSATRQVAQNRARKDLLAITAADVLGAKGLLLFGLVAVSGLAAWMVANFRHDPAYLIWSLPLTLAFGLSPFWYFQGTERMLSAVIVELASRAGAAGFTFLIVRNPQDGWKVLALQAIAGCACTLMQTLWMYREIGFTWPRWHSSWRALKQGWNMFLFRGAYNIYGSANAFILGIFVSPLQVGYFGGAERITKALQGLTLPLTQALYPRMSSLVSEDPKKAARWARFTVSASIAFGLFLGLVLALSSRWVVPLALGPEYKHSIAVLYVLGWFLPLNATNTALIMQWMLPFGLERLVGRVTGGAIAINVIAATVLAPRFAHLGMAGAMLFAETCKLTMLVILLFRVVPLRNLQHAKPEPVGSL